MLRFSSVKLGSARFLKELRSLHTEALVSPINKILKDEQINIEEGQPKQSWKNYEKMSRLPYVRFNALEPIVRKEIERSQTEKKLHLSTLPRFSSLLNGLRPNELTIFTGPTGCGKTTALVQMSLDYCLQGVRVLWGSFEIRNPRLAQVMLQQLAMTPLVNEETNTFAEKEYSAASQRLGEIPMHFMNLFGSTGLDTVLDTMEMSMRIDGPKPQLIILDNLQFMLSGQGSSSLDRWELMDRAIINLRAFCSAYPVHVILVVHPRKELDDTYLGIASVAGTAKATQEADNVFILQKLPDKRYLEIKKNRFHGELGRVRIGFVPSSRMIVEQREEEEPSAAAHSSADDQGVDF
ncbi:hypothetical protein PSACC_03676 [Paramicrosporidium saccamoebae]|uniref:SF4 helicase domain-containing protein n=1 Tax=Paramicrosporidium saccamoebae TaxID=1246581 RepID=A0A2H9TFD0_9FUNG|nr:hypothetical protein PSACC_03676 [Paramicrosporidium saccamoebae]